MNFNIKKLLLTLSLCPLSNSLYGAAAERAEVKGNAEQKENTVLQEQDPNLIFQNAILKEDLNTINQLIRHIDINRQDPLRGNTPLITQSISTSPDSVLIMKLLLENGAHPNIPNYYGETALTSLISGAGRIGRNQFMDKFNLLLKHGVDPHFKNHFSIEPIRFINKTKVYNRGNPDALKLLNDAKQLLEEYIKEYDSYVDLYEKYKKAKVRLAHQAAHKLPKEEELSANIIEYVPEPYMNYSEFVRRNETMKERGVQKGQKEKREKESN